MDSLSVLQAVSALDGRYRSQIADLTPVLSEGALIKARLEVEVRWLLHLATEPALAADIALPVAAAKALAAWVEAIPDSACDRVKVLEATTNHDVKAVEYLLREELSRHGLGDKAQAFIHFACTSEDINNVSYALMMARARAKVLLPAMDAIIGPLRRMAGDYAALPMLSRTHGQTATPTTLGKEMAVFAHRLGRQREALAQHQLLAKMNGAVGNYNAHVSAYPQVDWPALTGHFLEKLGLVQNPLTTQIENHDAMVEFADIVRRFNVIAIGLARDFWSYISIGYFRQQIKANEVGSSTMPHKVNPIDFENAEGNFGVANALLQHFGEKLPISRWQRDLSDSTVQRTLGTAFGHGVLACRALAKGLGKVAVDPQRLADDVEGAWEVLAEPIQTVMRRYGVMDAYERLKKATRGQAVTREALHALVDATAELPSEAKVALKAMRPEGYVGLAPVLARYQEI